MKVYVLSGCFDCEGAYVLGAYSSEEEAESAEKVFKTRGEHFFDNYRIDEVELNAPAEF